MEELATILASLNFPDLNTTSSKQIDHLFSAKGRQYLLGWVFEELYPGECLWSEETQVENLADLLYVNGFCTSSTKLSFAKGDGNLDVSLEIQTFKTILAVLAGRRASKDKTFSDSALHPSITDDELESVLRRDVNIFPDSKPLYKTAEERDVKIADYKRNVDLLKREIAALEEIGDTSVDYDTSTIETDPRRLERLTENVSDFREYVGQINESEPAKFDIDQEALAGTSSECRNVMRNMTQHFNDLQTISNFSESLSSIHMINGTINGGETIKHLLQVSEEVVNTK